MFFLSGCYIIYCGSQKSHLSEMVLLSIETCYSWPMYLVHCITLEGDTLRFIDLSINAVRNTFVYVETRKALENGECVSLNFLHFSRFCSFVLKCFMLFTRVLFCVAFKELLCTCSLLMIACHPPRYIPHL